jgi:hypothetical protein
VRNRVPELAEAMLSNLDETGIEGPVAKELAMQIRERCKIVRDRFRKR